MRGTQVDQTKPWQELSRTRAYDNFRRIDRVVYELPDGTQKAYDIEAHVGSVTIIAVTPDEQVIMVRQYRPGPDKVLLEFPGGVIEPGEQAQAAAARELLEETGYAGDLTCLGARYLDAYSTGVHYGFVATNCRRVADPRPDETEFMAIELISAARFKDVVRSDYAPGAGMGWLALEELGWR